MHRLLLLLLLILPALATAQKIGNYQPEVHPKLTWNRCADPSTPGACAPVEAEITLDAEYRWLHVVDDIPSCWTDRGWELDQCNTTESCTARCAVEGASYRDSYGLEVSGDDTLSQRFYQYHSFAENFNSRVFLMETADRYQTFTLLGNELAFDVDLSTVGCGLNGALHFLAMEPDGGRARFPGNEAGARYGTGYCDAGCPRYPRFVGGQANVEGWETDENLEFRGQGHLGACCPEFDVWNSNAHSFQTSSKPCIGGVDSYHVCHGDDCEGFDRGKFCDEQGCDYNPFRLGVTDFYGQGKEVDTTRKFTVVTQFAEDKVTKFFIQDGRKIDAPVPTAQGFPDTNGLGDAYCKAKTDNFVMDGSWFRAMGGWDRHNNMLRKPMVMALSIQNDYYAWNLWLDSTYPTDAGNLPGGVRGDCTMGGNEPHTVEQLNRNAKVVWSNIRFGPIGSTVNV